MATTRNLVQLTETQLKACDAAKSFSELRKAFDAITPTIHALLSLPLVAELTEKASPASCCHPLVAEFREKFVDAEDDVYFLVLMHVQRLVKDEVKAVGASSASQAELASRKRDRLGNKFTPSAGPSSSKTRLEFTANVYSLLYGREAVDPSHVSLRWKWLQKENDEFLQSSEYTNSNANERKNMALTTVLSVFSNRAHKHYFSSLWTSIFSLKLHPVLLTHLLTGISRCIMPQLTNPLVLADYLTESFNRGGLTAVLALEGLFVLMVDHGLEYPSFYEKLYQLIDAGAFSTRYRNQLFKLVDASLTSIRVPSYIAASFIKRTARVALFSPSPVLYFALPFLRHLLQRHPNCLSLIHRTRKQLQELEPSNGQEKGKREADSARNERLKQLFTGVDPFNAETLDLSQTNALDSSLWELCVLEQHFLPAVHLMVTAFASPVEDSTPLKFDKTYARLFAHEVTRKLNGKTSLARQKGSLKGPFGEEETLTVLKSLFQQ